MNTQPKPTTFRLMRALCRTMGKTQWCFKRNLYGESSSNYLRQKGEEDSCPLTFTWQVASGQFFHSLDWETVAVKLGFDEKLSGDIIMAADHGGRHSTGRTARLRRILLRAARLTEP